MTFSISARCARTGEFGIAVSSSSPAVAARCAHARAGAGAVATQNITDPTLGPIGLDLLAAGLSAVAAMERLKALALHVEYRQLALVDRAGETAAFSGNRTLGVHRTAQAPNVVAAGNLLKSPDVPAAMLAVFQAAPDQPLGARLLAAMRAAVAAGGEEGPVHSAGMLVVRDVAWPVADLRVDWHETDPIGALVDLWALWAPQMDAYVARALNPASAPAYGVPGDLAR
jgi:uncharacterized Ntn-hydrolase superfamily protein